MDFMLSKSRLNDFDKFHSLTGLAHIKEKNELINSLIMINGKLREIMQI